MSVLVLQAARHAGARIGYTRHRMDNGWITYNHERLVEVAL